MFPSKTTSVTAACLALGLPSLAQVLNPGDIIFPSLEHQITLGGTSIAGPISVAYSTDAFSGEVTSQVFTGDPANPFGGYTFAYKVSNSGTDVLSSFYVYNGFHDLHTAVKDHLGAGGTAPSSAARSTLAGDSGNGISFVFQQEYPGLPGGQSTAWLLVHTDSSVYHAGSAILSGYHDPTTFPVAYLDGVLAPVPEPAQLPVLSGLGLAVFTLGWRSFSRHRKP